MILYPERYAVAVIETCRLATREKRHCGLCSRLGNESDFVGNLILLSNKRPELLRQRWLGGWGERKGSMNEGPLARTEEKAKRIPRLQPPPGTHLFYLP